MYSSRSIDDLRPDVARNCRMLVEICRRRGYAVLVTGTVRDEEFQRWCYENGKSRGKVPTFHAAGVGLAFDVCQNVRGHEYDDPGFWRCVSAVGEAMGFEWGGRWKSFTDKPHFQWSERGKYASADILAGRRPAPMPAFEMEVEDMTKDELRALIRETVAEAEAERARKEPDPWSREDRLWAEENGIVLGDGAGRMSYKAPCTREQMTAFLHRLYRRLREEAAGAEREETDQ
jgi:hypothetical protein